MEQAETLRAMQELEQETYNFCVKTLGILFSSNYKSKTSPNITFSANAMLCRNDIYAILEYTMPVYTQPHDGIYAGLKAIESPDISTGSISNEAKKFIHEYRSKLANITAARAGQEEQRQQAAAPSPLPVRHLSLGESPDTQDTQRTTETLPRGGRRRGSRRGRRSTSRV
jgi:hypothetical protein